MVSTLSEGALRSVIDYFLARPPVTDDGAAQTLADWFIRSPNPHAVRATVNARHTELRAMPPTYARHSCGSLLLQSRTAVSKYWNKPRPGS